MIKFTPPAHLPQAGEGSFEQGLWPRWVLHVMYGAITNGHCAERIETAQAVLSADKPGHPPVDLGRQNQMLTRTDYLFG